MRDARPVTAALAAVTVALLAFIAVSPVLTRTFTAGKAWSGASLLAIVLAAVYAGLVYQSGYHGLSFAGLPALVLSQTFIGSLTGFPLVILLFPDGRAPSPAGCPASPPSAPARPSGRR